MENNTLQNLRDSLILKGLDKDIVNEVFDSVLPTTTVTIVLNYSQRSHALFGDFGKSYKAFKDDFLKNQGWLSYNGNLTFGPGWVIRKKEKLDEVCTALDDAKIPYQKIERSEKEKEILNKQT